ncbi:MAG: 50S ribosomal protein L23 [Gammaproteobacteria bacterium]|nr:50S ribosomal protein L23 [Gammaproteobacteria bacterium]MBU1960190.1 50S ribosomal protein L23 [Gammaproteobacteria bacterium]
MNKERLMKVLLSPLITEKSSNIADKARQIAFRVATDASKPEILAAVEMLFEVKVDNVRVINNKGKAKRHGAMMGRRSDWKKAYVKLMPGHDINFGGSA